MKLKVLLLLPVIFMVVAERANGRDQALPEELMKAKTLCLEVGDAVRVPVFHEPAKAQREALKLENTASEALKKWGRFDVASHCGNADAVLRVRGLVEFGTTHFTLTGPGPMTTGASGLEFSITRRALTATPI